MAQNIEIKARVRDIDGMRRDVQLIAVSGPEVILQRDTFYRVSDGRLKLREFGDGAAELIHYHREDSSSAKLSTYTRISVGPVEDLKRVLTSVLPLRGVITKQRELYRVGRTRVHLDNVEHLGWFLELEVVLCDRESLVDGQREAGVLMRQLKVTDEDLLAVAYIDLLEAATCVSKAITDA